MRIEEVEGIGPAHGNSLNAAGVLSTEELLTQGATTAGRASLAQATGISHELILTWVNHADLMRIKGVGPEYSELLEAAGVDSPAELAHRNPANLETTFQEVAAARPDMVRRIPSEAEITDWIEQSKSLPKVVEHGGGHAAPEAHDHPAHDHDLEHAEHDQDHEHGAHEQDTAPAVDAVTAAEATPAPAVSAPEPPAVTPAAPAPAAPIPAAPAAPVAASPTPPAQSPAAQADAPKGMWARIKAMFGG